MEWLYHSKNCKNLRYLETLLTSSTVLIIIIVGSVVKWLERRDCDRHGLGSKSTCAFLLCSWERHFTAFFPAWWSWQAVLNFCFIFIKFQADSYILASPKAGRSNCIAYVLVPLSLSCELVG